MSRRSFVRAVSLALLALPFFCQCASIVRRPGAGNALEIPGRSHWTADDGKRLPFTRWPAEGKPVPKRPRSVIICVHGLSGAASDFRALGEHFEKRGSVVYAMELRGQGNDPDRGTRGDIRSSDLWINDLYAFTRMVNRRHPGARVFWYGESMGALISIQALARADENKGAGGIQPVSGLILASPVTSFRYAPPRWKEAAVRTLMTIAPALRISLESLGSREVREQNVTSTTTHHEQMERTPHYVRTFTFRLFRELDKLVATSVAAGSWLREPVLVLYTPNDVFTSKEGVEAFFDHVGSASKRKVFYPDSYHLILHDKDRSKALRAVDSWIRAQ